MEKPKQALLRIFFQFGTLLLLYSLCRLLFWWAHHAAIDPEAGFSTTAARFGEGLRFDVAAICLTNAAFVLLALLPFPFVRRPFYQSALQYIFVVSNSLFLLLNFADIVYFPFVQKRMQADALLFVTGAKGGDLYRLLPRFLYEFWYLWVVFFAFVYLLWRAYRRSLRITEHAPANLKSFALATLLYLGAIAATVVGGRGGLQLKPLDIIHAAAGRGAPLVLNSPFSVLKTLDKGRLPALHYFPDSLLNDCDKGLRTPLSGSTAAAGPNVVVIIVESLSKEYMGFFQGKAKTPFLDSLFAQSLVFPNAFANGKESIHGIPAVLASIPACQDDPFIFSPYSTNRIGSLANLLKPLGYRSAFFHGGTKGTMGFDSFAELAGFDAYFGRESYGNEADYDGHWGIWDEPFLQYSADQISALPQPFAAAIFTLNSHHPFQVPEAYRTRFAQDGHPILTCVQYADFALQRFFEKAKQQPWYPNTLFVVTADHTGPALGPSDYLNNYRIPIAFFKPDGSLKGLNETIANQIDILPSVLHLLGYSRPYFSFGKSLFDPACERFSVNYHAGVYSYIDSAYYYRSDGQTCIGFYNWKQDPAFRKNRAGQDTPEKKSCETNLKKFIQVFNNAMISNGMRAVGQVER